MEKLEKRRRYCSCAPTGLSTKPMRMCYDRSWSCWESRNVIRRLRSIISSVLQSLMTWDSSPTNAPPICSSFCGSSNFSENVLLYTLLKEINSLLATHRRLSQGKVKRTCTSQMLSHKVY